MSARVTITIPEWLDRICAWPVMAYRRHKYGFSFRRIYLGEGEWTILDQEDYYRFANFKWVINKSGKSFYAARIAKIGPGRTKITSLHREIMPSPRGFVIDHKNGITLDNRRSNLRLATRSENAMNCRRDKSKTTSRFVGVYLHKLSGKWSARIRYRGKRKYLGVFVNEIDAAKAYDRAAKKHHGEFARLNFTP